jgi:hypothetical protein
MVIHDVVVVSIPSLTAPRSRGTCRQSLRYVRHDQDLPAAADSIGDEGAHLRGHGDNPEYVNSMRVDRRAPFLSRRLPGLRH